MVSPLSAEAFFNGNISFEIKEESHDELELLEALDESLNLELKEKEAAEAEGKKPAKETKKTKAKVSTDS